MERIHIRGEHSHRAKKGRLLQGQIHERDRQRSLKPISRFSDHAPEARTIEQDGLRIGPRVQHEVRPDRGAVPGGGQVKEKRAAHFVSPRSLSARSTALAASEL